MGSSSQVAQKGQTAVVPISSEQTLKASKALLSHMKKASKEAAASSEKKNLLEDVDEAETPIWLTVTTKRNIHDSNKLKPGKVTLPHPLNKTEPETTICLIVADPQRFYKDVVASDDFPSELAKRITRVVDLKHLQAKFKTFEAQRQLYSEHDVFLADERIINRLPKALGKTFFRTTTKRPVSVKLHKVADKAERSALGQKKPQKDQGSSIRNARPAAEMAKEIEAAVGAAVVHLNTSTSTAVKVGYAGFTPSQLAENVEAVARALVSKFIPRGLDNIRALYIKGPETAALPIWQTTELWLDTKDVLAEGSAELKALEDKKLEKANVGKKRKAPAIEDAEANTSEAVTATEPTTENPAKKKKSKKAVIEGDDAKLDEQIKERKEKLKKQKKAAKATMED